MLFFQFKAFYYSGVDLADLCNYGRVVAQDDVFNLSDFGSGSKIYECVKVTKIRSKFVQFYFVSCLLCCTAHRNVFPVFASKINLLFLRKS